jgi:two-component SAPR family response regulator
MLTRLRKIDPKVMNYLLSLFSEFVPIFSCVSKDAQMMAYVVSPMQEQDLDGTVPKEEKQHAVPHLL